MRSISDAVANLLKRASPRRRRASDRCGCQRPIMFAEILAASTFPEFTDIPLELWRRKQDESGRQRPPSNTELPLSADADNMHAVRPG